MTKKIKKLSGSEREWITSQLRASVQFVDTFSPDDAGKPLSLRVFDRAFNAWIETNEANTKRVHDAINCVGIALGQFLVDGFGLEWVTVTDEQGSNLAVRGLPDQGNVLIYPAKIAAKRWEARDTPSFEESYYQIGRQVAKIARTATVRKPWWKFW